MTNHNPVFVWGGLSKDPVFEQEEIDLLSDPSRWRLIASFLPCDKVNDASYEKWSVLHTERHPQREIVIVLSGECLRGYCGHIYKAGPGTVLLHNAMEPHDRNYPSPHPAGRHIIINFFNDICFINLFCIGRGAKRRGYVEKLSIPYPLASLGLASPAVLFPDAESDAPPEMTRARCMNALKLLVSAIVEKMYCSSVPCNSQHEHVIQGAVRYIKESNGRCNLKDMAVMSGYSRFYFCRLFHAHTNTSFTDYVKGVRIQSFRQMIAEGKQLKVIARALGFAHESALSRWRRQNKV